MTVHVAVAAIVNSNNEVLISLRRANQHQGGLWEFPGGKVETTETVHDALRREIKEELNIHILKAEPFIQIRHDYADKAVLLDVWEVRDFEGIPIGYEGQSVRWQSIVDLDASDFPVANAPIIEALQQLFN